MFDCKDLLQSPAIKHGIEIREHKKWNAKTVYNRGNVMRIYRHCPKSIYFQSPMVNDFNQHLCNGWQMADIPDTDEAIIQQLLMGKKPFGVATYYWGERKEERAVDALHRLKKGGITAQLREKVWYEDKVIYDVMGCQDITVKEIGDLEALTADYAAAGVLINVRPFANESLSTFFDGFDVTHILPWQTGLILGYPIENTISLYAGY